VCKNLSSSESHVNTQTSDATVMLVGCFPWRNCGHHSSTSNTTSVRCAFHCLHKKSVHTLGMKANWKCESHRVNFMK